MRQMMAIISQKTTVYDSRLLVLNAKIMTVVPRPLNRPRSRSTVFVLYCMFYLRFGQLAMPFVQLELYVHRQSYIRVLGNNFMEAKESSLNKT